MKPATIYTALPKVVNQGGGHSLESLAGAAPSLLPEAEVEALLARPYDEKGQLPALLSYKRLGVIVEPLKEVRQELVVGSNRADLIKRVNTAYRLIMCNMVACVFERKPLSLPGSDRSYSSGTAYRKMFLTWPAVDLVTKELNRLGYITKNPASKVHGRVNSYQPTRKLELLLLPLVYQVVEEYTDQTPLVKINPEKAKKRPTTKKQGTKKPRGAHRAVGAPGAEGAEGGVEGSGGKEREGTMYVTSYSLSTYDSDMASLRRINEALKHCTYALKSPVTRIYSDNNTMKGGRLYVRLQGLPDRRARIRINTLFNGEAICEVDLSSNHPRMLMALAKKELSATFYDDVAKATGTTREQVKFLLVKALGAENRSISLKPEGAEKDWTNKSFVLTQIQRELIEHHIKEHYPDIYLGFYSKSTGTYLQGLEGDILLQAMLALLDENIPSLPMHDAIYVQQRYKGKARDALENAWMDTLGVTFRPPTKTDFPD